jgi:hypothetical protein
MLLFAPALVSLLLAAPVFSGVTPANPIAQKRSVVDLTYDIPQTRLLTQIQRAFGKVVHYWSMKSGLLSPCISSMEDSYYVSSVKTQYALTFPESFPC